ncbi:MAG: hypothetical protein ACI38Y_00510 [Candidatus Methanomethylophilaceae archaeon]
MVLNRKGMIGMVDAMAFIVIITVALSVTISYIDPPDWRDPSGDVLDTICGVQVRLSDMTELEDDSLIFLTDLIALDIHNGGHGSLDYLSQILDVYSSGRGYLLELTFDGKTVSMGTDVGGDHTFSQREVFISTGGKLTMRLTMAS